MAYDKRTWKIGEEITADKLNHMEDGIAAGGSGGGSEPLIVNDVYDETTDTGRLDRTWQEIRDAFPNVYLNYPLNNIIYPPGTMINDSEENYYAVNFGAHVCFCESPSDYPKIKS